MNDSNHFGGWHGHYTPTASGELSIGIANPGLMTWEVQTVAAAELADHASLISDLELVARRCDAMADQPDEWARDALWEAALIAYRRCFKSGAPAVRVKGISRQHRTKIDDAFLRSILTPAEVARHREMLALADQHIAHGVTREGESIRVAAVERESDGRVVDVIVAAIRQGGSPDGSHGLHGLATKIGPALDDQMKVKWRSLYEDLSGTDPTGE